MTEAIASGFSDTAVICSAVFFSRSKKAFGSPNTSAARRENIFSCFRLNSPLSIFFDAYRDTTSRTSSAVPVPDESSRRNSFRVPSGSVCAEIIHSPPSPFRGFPARMDSIEVISPAGAPKRGLPVRIRLSFIFLTAAGVFRTASSIAPICLALSRCLTARPAMSAIWGTTLHSSPNRASSSRYFSGRTSGRSSFRNARETQDRANSLFFPASSSLTARSVVSRINCSICCQVIFQGNGGVKFDESTILYSYSLSVISKNEKGMSSPGTKKSSITLSSLSLYVFFTVFRRLPLPSPPAAWTMQPARREFLSAAALNSAFTISPGSGSSSGDSPDSSRKAFTERKKSNTLFRISF